MCLMCPSVLRSFCSESILCRACFYVFVLFKLGILWFHFIFFLENYIFVLCDGISIHRMSHFFFRDLEMTRLSSVPTLRLSSPIWASSSAHLPTVNQCDLQPDLMDGLCLLLQRWNLGPESPGSKLMDVLTKLLDITSVRIKKTLMLYCFYYNSGLFLVTRADKENSLCRPTALLRYGCQEVQSIQPHVSMFLK